MAFDYDVMPKRNKEDSKGNTMRKCNNCGNRTYMLYEEDENYKVVCEYCEEEHCFKAKSMDEAMDIWSKLETEAECEYCPLGWEERGYEGECYDCGCMAHADKIPQDETSWCKKSFEKRWERYQELVKD